MTTPLFYFDPATGYFSFRSGPEKDSVQVQGMCGPTWSTHQDAAGTFVVCRGNDWLIGHSKAWSSSGLQHGAEHVNCPTVDGRGQDNMLDRTAHVLRCEDKPSYALWQVEAGQSYDYSLSSSNRIHPLKSWRRTLCFLKSGVLFVHDRVEKSNPNSQLGWYLNANPQSVFPFVGVPRFGWTSGQSSVIGDVATGGNYVFTALNLGPGGARSSARFELRPVSGQPVDEFLVVFQLGASGFTPLPVTRTALGAQVGDDEFTIQPDGTVALVDHRISPKEAALNALYWAVDDWHSNATQSTEGGVITAAQNLLLAVGPREDD